MGKYIIDGGNVLNGEVFISGAKNSALPILAASILNSGKTILHNVPLLSDTFNAIDILKTIGCEVKINGHTVVIDSKNANNTNLSENLVKKMRSSIIFLGSLIARFKNAKIYAPGGCKLGKRPINFHLDAFKMMDIFIFQEQNFIHAVTNQVKNIKISLPFPSVGATQNIILSSIFTDGATIIENCAKEPEIIDLQNFLNKMGANVFGAGTSCITVCGVKRLNSVVEYTIMPDRIEAGTFLCAATLCGGEVNIYNIILKHLQPLIKVLVETGADITFLSENSLNIKAPNTIKPVKFIETGPYDMFATDLQPQIMTVLTISSGTSIIKESVFEARNKHIFELNKMGADIIDKNNTFVINGVKSLKPNTVFAKDLRGGAALILAGLKAKGQTIVVGSKYVKRGYEEIEDKLFKIGANIKYIED